MRGLWNVRLNAGLRLIDEKLSYSKFIGAMTKKGVLINRKMLAELAEKNPDSFARVVKQIA